MEEIQASDSLFNYQNINYGYFVPTYFKYKFV
jgi:hypothetical protein